MTMNIEFSELAEHDINSLRAYTLRQWGVKQLHQYEKLLGKALDHIAQFPNSGALLPEHGLRMHPAGKHMIVYRAYTQSITIVRVLHSGMNIPNHLLH